MSVGSSCNTATDCMLLVEQDGFGGVTRESVVGGGVGAGGGLSPSHTLCLLAICWGFIIAVRVSVCEEGGGGVGLGKGGEWCGGVHSVTL